MLDERSWAEAASSCARSRPPVYTFCDTWRPSTHWFLAPNPVLLKSKPLPPPLDGHVMACASAALRSAAVAVDAICGAHSDGVRFVVVSREPDTLSPENCDLSVLVYPALPVSCGSACECVWRICADARACPARATPTASLSATARRMASSMVRRRAACAGAGAANASATSERSAEADRARDANRASGALARGGERKRWIMSG